MQSFNNNFVWGKFRDGFRKTFRELWSWKQQELVILSSDPGPEENDPFILLHLVTLYFWIHASWGEELRDSDETTDPRLTSKLNEVG